MDTAGMNKCLTSFVACAGRPCACTAQQLYGAGQAWQKQECNKIVYAQERGRCMASNSTTYEQYRRQAEATKARP
jgi:hypothetical protein